MFTVLVAEAFNGEEAWRYIQVSWPKILIADIMMPKKGRTMAWAWLGSVSYGWNHECGHKSSESER